MSLPDRVMAKVEFHSPAPEALLATGASFTGVTLIETRAVLPARPPSLAR
jgi:hypothetical protein